MITITTPLMESAAGGISIGHFLASGSIATVVLIIALILKELLDDGSEDAHKKHVISALNIAISPLTFIFAVVVVYKIIEVLKF